MLVGNIQKVGTIESYSNKLIFLLQTYLNNINVNANNFSVEANKKAKITLRALIFPNEKEFINDYRLIENDIGRKTSYIISNYTKCIMQLLGRLAECVVIDNCMTNNNINLVCMNVALLKENIYINYPMIEYSSYMPFSPSFKYIFIYNDGQYIKYNVPEYNPHDTSKDIAWCKRNNILSQLKLEIRGLDVLENAKLQIKTSLNYSNIILNSTYYLTPIIYFDLLDDADLLKKKYPQNYILSARQINGNMMEEVRMYFKILAAYITGLVDRIDLKDFNVDENEQLTYLFRSDIRNLINPGIWSININEMINQAKEYRKPIVVGV